MKPLTSATGDHPRMGGEKVQILLYEDIQKGSPPHGRGKVPHFLCFDLEKRITPAWAGKSEFSTACFKRHWDHPRMGGEKFW